MCRRRSVPRPDQHRAGPRHTRRATWTTRRRSANLRRVPAPANDNRFKMTRAGRLALLALVLGVTLAVALILLP